MSLYKQYQTDSNIEKQGIVLEYGFNAKGKPISIRVARAGGSNEQFNKVLEHEMKPYRRQIQTETMDNKLAERLMQKVYARTIVLDWENVDIEKTENGPAIPDAPFNEENALRLFADLPDLWSDIQKQAANVSLYRKEIQEADAKN